MKKIKRKVMKKAPSNRKQVRLRDDGTGHEQVYDVAELRQLDQAEGRYHLTGDEVDAAVKLALAREMIDWSIETLRPFLQKYKAYQMVRSASGCISKAMIDVRNAISAEQLVMISNNTTGADCMLIHDPKNVPPLTVVVANKHLGEIINQATRVCALTCTMTRDQSKSCPLRIALDNIPGLKKDAKLKPLFDGSLCPYMMYERIEEAFGNVSRE